MIVILPVLCDAGLRQGKNDKTCDLKISPVFRE
jgi:hypothetical protein